MYQIIQKRNYFLTFSATLMIASAIALSIWGLKLGIDFTGGSLLEVRFLSERPAVSAVETAVKDLDLGGMVVQPVGDSDMILRFQNTSDEKRLAALKSLNSLAGGSENKDNKLDKIEEVRYDAVGPNIGQELKRNSVTAVIIASIAIILYIAWAFRKISKPVSSWKFGVAAVIALLHDVLITAGAFALLGKFMGIEIGMPFIAAILTILGYSVNDTIVVFDRIRETLPRSDKDFEGTVNDSINQTIARSINTSLTVELVLVSMLFFGGSTIRDFILALIIGIFYGTYSSIFVAPPIVVIWEKATKRK